MLRSKYHTDSMNRLFTFFNKQSLKKIMDKPIVKKPIPPVYPDLASCCGDDCPNCVWVDYFDKYEEYQKKMKIYNQYKKDE